MLDGTDLNHHIAQRVRQLRAGNALSLDALAQRSGVSRSMISVIERAEASPTAVVLDKLATALGVTLAALFDVPPASVQPVARRADQPQWQDPGSGYRRRKLSPAGLSSPLQLVEVHFPPGARVAYESGARRSLVQQQLWLMAGCLDVQLGDQAWHLEAGDCWACTLDRPNSFHNPGDTTAHYLVAICDRENAP